MSIRFSTLTLVILLTLSMALAACASPSATQAPLGPTEVQAGATEPPSPEPLQAPTEEPAAEPIVLRVGAKCGATPHAMPLFLMLAQTGGELAGVRIEYVPITEPPQMAALLSNGDVDVVLAQIINPAKMYLEGIPDLRLNSLSMSKGVYVVAGEDVASWADLEGKRVLMPDANSGPAFLGRASMRAAGFDPDADFAIEYMPASQIVQLMVAGEASAAVMEEPNVTVAITKAKQEGVAPLRPAPMDVYSLFASESWPAGQLPLDGVLVLQPILDQDATRAALEQFVAAYNASIEYMLSNPAEASELIAQQLTAQCDSMMQPDPLEKALSSGRLAYDPRPVGDLLPDLDTYIELILGTAVDEGYYAQP